jgi:hypothetical protein
LFKITADAVGPLSTSHRSKATFGRRVSDAISWSWFPSLWPPWTSLHLFCVCFPLAALRKLGIGAVAVVWSSLTAFFGPHCEL